MNLNLKWKKLLLAILSGVILGSILTTFVYSILFYAPTSTVDIGKKSLKEEEKKPLYWVAPMDPNYRRDKPGQSPMGMDLIPFYGDSDTAIDEGPGTIKISPSVVNNLGVRSAKVLKEALHLEINTVGYVQYDEDQLVHIHPRVEGWIEKLYVKASGDPVKKGQPLYEIYSPALVNAQEEFVLALERHNKRLVRAAEDRLKALQLPLSVINRLRRDKKVKQNVIFFAPQSGVVGNLNIRQGFFVKPGTLIMSVGSLEQVWVEAEVFERQALQVKAGSLVTMTLDYLPGKKWRGSVDYIYPTLDAKTRTVKVRLRFDNKGHSLKPNMFAQVVIHADSVEKVLLVPKEAVIRSGSIDRVVLALGEGHFKSVEVTLGRFAQGYYEVLSGVKEEELVVTSAQFLLDSESSKTSDFKRMSDDSQDGVTQRELDDSPQSVSSYGLINSIMPGHKMLNISREAIEKWGQPAATLDFIVEKDIDLARLQAGMKVQFTFYISDEAFIINSISESQGE